MSLLIAIEGIDGSGKGTQASRLVERLDTDGISCSLLSFPRYSETLFGESIGKFLNGDFGPLEAVAPQLAATLYAGDRFESRGMLLEALATQQVVVCDRYVPSNLAHQGSRVEDERQSELIEWIETIEYDVFQLPRPAATTQPETDPAQGTPRLHKAGRRPAGSRPRLPTRSPPGLPLTGQQPPPLDPHRRPGPPNPGTEDDRRDRPGGVRGGVRADLMPRPPHNLD